MSLLTAVWVVLLIVFFTIVIRARVAKGWVREGRAATRRIVTLMVVGVAVAIALQIVLWMDPALSMLLRFWLTLGTVSGTLLLILRLSRSLALADRRVDRRLGVLLLFATVVPTIIVATLWVFSAVLGTASDRALAAARAYQAEARRLEDELALAVASPPEAEARLEALAAARGRRGEALTVWLRRGGWRRVTGDAALPAPALDSWPAGGPSMVVVERRSFVAARVAAPRDSALVAVGVVPARGALGDDISRRVGARLVFSGAAGGRVAVTPRGLSVGGPVARGPIRLDELSPFAGFANAGGWLWTAAGWVPSANLLAVQVGAAAALGGMVRNAQTSALAYVPVVLIGLILVMGVRVMWMNWATLRALGDSITRAIAALRGGAAALEAGRLEHRIAVQGDDELWDVAASFNRMAEGLARGRALELERERLESELALARRIQARLLPARPPGVEGLDIAGLSEPARAVGGDYYDHLLLGDGRVALVIADVSGKGVPAALLMSAFRASLISQLEDPRDPAWVMERVNRFLHRSVEPGRFVTAFLGVLDPRSGRLEYCNAGHNPPYVIAPDGAAATLETGGLLLGMLEEGAYQKGVVDLAPGASLALFTDGVTEAQAASGAMWGEAPLVERLRRGAAEPRAALARSIVEEVRRFEGDQGPSDDITLLLARRAPAS